MVTLETEIGRLKSGGLSRRELDGYDHGEYLRKDDHDRDRDPDRGRQPNRHRTTGIPPSPEEAGEVRDKS